MAESAVDPFANGANPFRGPINPFADLPPVPIGGTGSTPANGVRGAVSFTDAANPFSDLPPLPVAPSNGAIMGQSDSGQQTLDLINSVRNAPPENQKPGGVPYQGAPAVAPSAPDSGQQTLDLINSVRAGTATTASKSSEAEPPPHPGALANAPGDNVLTQAGKGAATAAVKGAGDIPGIIGNLGNLGGLASDYLGATIMKGTSAAGIHGNGPSPPDTSGSIGDIAARLGAERQGADARLRASNFPVISDYVPSGESFSNPVLAKTGEYVPGAIQSDAQ